MSDFSQLQSDLNENMPNTQESITKWIDYSKLVRDQDKVLDHILTFSNRQNSAQIYLQKASFYEYQRDFENASKVYLQGGELVN